jgi:TrmH family RNA methyltransferase
MGLDRRALFLEGVRLIEDTVHSNIDIESLIVARDLLTRPHVKNLVDQLARQGVRCEVSSWDILEYLSDVETPQGILAIAQRQQLSLNDVLAQIEGVPLLVVVEGWRDPGNLGTLLRSGEALGVHAVVTTPQTVDPFSPKVVRASMGSALRVPIIDQANLPFSVRVMKQRGLQVWAATRAGDRLLTESDFTPPTALLVGNEAFGLTEEASTLATGHVRIPMRGQVESLNAAMAATILLYEAARQRGFATLT